MFCLEVRQSDLLRSGEEATAVIERALSQIIGLEQAGRKTMRWTTVCTQHGVWHVGSLMGRTSNGLSSRRIERARRKKVVNANVEEYIRTRQKHFDHSGTGDGALPICRDKRSSIARRLRPICAISNITITITITIDATVTAV